MIRLDTKSYEVRCSVCAITCERIGIRIPLTRVFTDSEALEEALATLRYNGWEIKDGKHKCPDCVSEEEHEGNTTIDKCEEM